MLRVNVQRYEKVGQSESESDWSRDEKKDYSQDEGETDIESQVGYLHPYSDYTRQSAALGWWLLIGCTAWGCRGTG
jgi:hypothetical protein